MAADRFVPGARRRIQREIGMGREKGVGLRLVLLDEQRAGRVDEPAARLYQPRRAGQDVALALDQLGEVAQRAAPLAVRVAAPAADTEARRVDEHPVEA